MQNFNFFLLVSRAQKIQKFRIFFTLNFHPCCTKILYIAGLPFRGFLDACHEIARRKFFDGDKLKMMDDFIEYCEINLREEQQYQARNMPRLPNRKARPHGYPLLTPMMPTLNVSDDTAEKLYVNKSQNLQQPKSANDVEAFLRRRGNLKPVKSSGKTRSKSRLKQDSEED